MNAKKWVDKMLGYINPPVPVGGLEITDSYLRYAKIAGEELKTASVRLTAGVLRDGKILDQPAYVSALTQLHLNIAPPGVALHVVASISASGIYSQMFSIPALRESQLEEALKLNLQMITPLGAEKTYFDAEELSRTETGERDYLGAFAERELIDSHLDALHSAGFREAAVEFSALSVGRTVSVLGQGYELSEPHLVVNVSSDGIDLMILRGGKLYFHYFTNWSAATGGSRTLEWETFQGVLGREAQKVLNFYTGKWGGGIAQAVVISKGLRQEIAGYLETKFGLKMESFALSRFRGAEDQWVAALGAAVRGELSRAEDVFISLAPVGTEDAFRESHLRHFSRFWRNAYLAVFGFILIAYLVTDSIFARMEAGITSRLREISGATAVEEVSTLTERAGKFNRMIALITSAKEKAIPVASLFEQIKKTAGTSIELRRVYYEASGDSALVVGRAATEVAAINFKNNLAKVPEFTDVALPFSNITQESDGKVLFQLTFSVKK